MRGRTRKRWPRCVSGLVIRGRQFTQADLVLARRLIRENSNWGRTKLSQDLCYRWGWLHPNGRAKERACRVALLRLESMKLLDLPARHTNTGGRPPIAPPLVSVIGAQGEIHKIRGRPWLVSVDSSKEALIWNSAIATYHYLGLGTPVGRLVRYLAFADGKLVGALSFSECAWRLAPRDLILRQLQIDPSDTRSHVVNNNRFLILPSVHVRNLASRILSTAIRSIRHDWRDRYGTSPVLAETFVDLARFRGTCYLAANWLRVGRTKGFGKSGSRHYLHGKPKHVFMRGLTKRSHRLLALAIIKNRER